MLFMLWGPVMNVELMCIVLLALLTIVLGIFVTVARGKFNVLSGSADDPEDTLNKLIRAHGNTIEYAPVLMILIYILSQYEYAAWVGWFIALVTFCRYLFVLGIIVPKTMAKPNPMRFVGAVGTYIFGLGLCFALLRYAV